jgi:hypothetical protein
VPTIVVSAWARREERAFAHPTDWFHGIDPLGISVRLSGGKMTERERIEARLMEYADAAAAAVAAGSQQRFTSYKTSIGNVF